MSPLSIKRLFTQFGCRPSLTGLLFCQRIQTQAGAVSIYSFKCMDKGHLLMEGGLLTKLSANIALETIAISKERIHLAISNSHQPFDPVFFFYYSSILYQLTETFVGVNESPFLKTKCIDIYLIAVHRNGQAIEKPPEYS